MWSFGAAELVDPLDQRVFLGGGCVQLPLGDLRLLLEPKLSPEDRAKLRKAGVWTAVPFGDEVFLPGHYMSDGTSADVVAVSNQILNTVVALRRWLVANADQVLKSLENLTGSRPAELRLQVGDLDAPVPGQVSLIDTGTAIAFYAGCP